jgi:hypothetical protein
MSADPRVEAVERVLRKPAPLSARAVAVRGLAGDGCVAWETDLRTLATLIVAAIDGGEGS